MQSFCIAHKKGAQKQTTHSSLSLAKNTLSADPTHGTAVSLSKVDFSNQIREGWSSPLLGCQSGRISLNSWSSICWLLMNEGGLRVWMNKRSSSRVCLCHNLICMRLWGRDEKSPLVARATEALTKYADSPQKHSCWFWFWISTQRNVISDLAAEAGWDSSEISICSCLWLNVSMWGIWFLFFFSFFRVALKPN